MDYGQQERRRTKKDLKRKRKFRAYKKGGKFRSSEISEDKGVGGGKGKGKNKNKGKKKKR